MTQATGFKVERIEPVTLARTNRLANMYVLSPFVWRADGRYHLLLRCVPRRDDEPRLKMAEIWYGVSDDGLHFVMDEAPVIFPGPDLADLDGCEDPTVLIDGDLIRVWYTGYNERERTGRLMLARGPGIRHLAKAGVVLHAQPPRFANPKEPSVVPTGSGWRMFFEYARDEASLIGRADADDLDGVWQDPADAPLAPRTDSWDAWHLSPGPVIGVGGEHPTMFYNGAGRDADWRIGWATFDRDFDRVVARCGGPLISPEDVQSGPATDIAFAASAVEEGGAVLLYYSESDQHLRRAVVKAV